jgi:hypothetical protein
MRPPVWEPPIALSATEQTIVKRIKRATLFVFCTSTVTPSSMPHYRVPTMNSSMSVPNRR